MNSRQDNQLPPNKSHSLSELIQYATDSTVSRTILKSDAGTVTLFAFDRGQSLSEHTTPFDAIAHVIDGTGEFTVGGRTIKANAGELVMLPRNVGHSVHAVSRFKMILVMLKSGV